MKEQISEKRVKFDMIFAEKKKENVGGENSSEIKHLPHKSNSEFGSPDTYLDSLPAYLALEGGAGIPRY